ncbi:MAG: nuclear transport factor 2 family protein [Actinobacteria bacterium]|nr:nuclear transport factor 2 family protein [Actinomycetota bacterium]
MNYHVDATDDEVEAAVTRYLALRTSIEEEGGDWGALADCFTEDAVWCDVAWGRVEGRENIAAFLREAMVGVDTQNPIDFWAADGPRVMVKWRQIFPGATKADGRPYEQSAVTTLIYAGDGLFSYEEDLMNMAHCVEDITASGWMPGDGFNMPPASPDRDFDPAPRP